MAVQMGLVQFLLVFVLFWLLMIPLMVLLSKLSMLAEKVFGEPTAARKPLATKARKRAVAREPMPTAPLDSLVLGGPAPTKGGAEGLRQRDGAAGARAGADGAD